MFHAKRQNLWILAGIVFACLLVASGCDYIFGNEKTRNPKLDYKAFDSIGDQGIKEDITMEELEGEYKGTVRFEEYKSTLYSTEELGCIGKVVDNILMIEWTMSENNMFKAEEIPPFELDKGVITAPQSTEELPLESDLSMICAVKVYPSGHMMEGMINYDLPNEQGTLVSAKIRFQLIKDE